jgi:hypothetical protein
MGEGPYISKQPESGVVGDSGGECPEQSVSQIEQCQKLGVSGARGDAGCRGEYTGCLLERAGMLGEYMVVPCECMSTEAGLDGTGLGVLKCLRLIGRGAEWFSLPDTVNRLSCED